MENKKSKQREAIIEVLRNTKSHPNADYVYNETRKIIPNVSLGTIYRNLSKLSEAGIIKKLDIDSESDHFDGNVKQHYHAVCRICGKVSDVDMPVIQTLDKTAEKYYDGKIDEHSIVFYGECFKCIKKKK